MMAAEAINNAGSNQSSSNPSRFKGADGIEVVDEYTE